MTNKRNFRITTFLAGALLCVLMVMFATAVKVSGYRREASARALSTLKLWDPGHARTSAADHATLNRLPLSPLHADLPDARRAMERLYDKPLAATAYRPVLSFAAAWFASGMRLRPPPLR